MRVVALIIVKNKVLLIKRGDLPIWSLPGGKVLPYESPKKAIIREIYEETRLQLADLEPSTKYPSKYVFFEKSQLYICHLESAYPKTTDEAIEISLVDIDKAIEIAEEPFKQYLEDGINKVARSKLRIDYKTIIQFTRLHPIWAFRLILNKSLDHLSWIYKFIKFTFTDKVKF